MNKGAWRYDTRQLIAYDQINPTQYIFHEDTETFTIAYTSYDPDYQTFYQRALHDMEKAKETREYHRFYHKAKRPVWNSGQQTSLLILQRGI